MGDGRYTNETILEYSFSPVSYTHLHEHIDHVYALPSLLHHLWLGGRAKALDIYIPEGMEPLVNGLIDLFGIRTKSNMFEIRIHTEAAFDIGALHVTEFPTDHTDTSIGIVVELSLIHI